MSSFDDGLGKGCGCVMGIVVAIVILVILFGAMGSHVQLCSTCFGSGNCPLCGGTGKGILFGDCMKCGGKKVCPECEGGRFKWK